MPKTVSASGSLERSVLDALWSAPATDLPTGELTVREVFERLGGEDVLAYTTVMTVLDRLARKDLATRRREGRAWVYRAAHTREQLTAEAMRERLEQDDSVDRRAAMLHFLGGASSDELADLRAALAELEDRLA